MTRSMMMWSSLCKKAYRQNAKGRHRAELCGTKSLHQAEARAEQAEARAEQAEARADQAGARARADEEAMRNS